MENENTKPENGKQENDSMKQYSIERDGKRNLTFQGDLLGTGGGYRNDCGGRWTEIEIYRTKGGKFILSIVGRTQWQGESQRHAASIHETEAEVIAELEQPDYNANVDAIYKDSVYLSDVAKEALDNAGIDYSEAVE